jgi:hypothetical protein
MTDERLAELGRFINGQRRRAQLSVRKLSELAGVSHAPRSRVDVKAEITRDPTLRDDQRATLVHIYESFQATNAATDPPQVAPDGIGAESADRGDG